MKELYLLRHCKSDWSGALPSDSERPLSERGIKNAAQIGEWMQEHGLLPGIILSSTALRAKQTIQLVSKQLDIDQSNIQYLPELYLASISTLLMIIGEYRDKPGSLMLIGHNPGLDELTTYLADGDVPYTDNGKLMTTGCLAHFSIPEDEPKLQANCKLLSITRPSELRRLT